MNKIAIIGGGAAGMMAAYAAAKQGSEVHLFEKNEKLGKKLFITGKGRCNITNACDPQEFFPQVTSNFKFFYSPFYTFSNHDVMELFDQNNCMTKTERGNRVFPESDHSYDVIRCLENLLKQYHVVIHTNTTIQKIKIENQQIQGIYDTRKTFFACSKVLIATGGLSYPTTGSTGDGYQFGKAAGHTVTELMPSLVPLNTKEEYIPRLQGLSLKNVTLRIYQQDKVIFEDFGEMLFTHFGISGPLVLSASSKIGKELNKQELHGEIDLKPAIDFAQLEKRVIREFDYQRNKQFRNAISSFFLSKMIPEIIQLSGIDPEKKVNEITKEERDRFIHLMKGFPFTITGHRGYKEAVITKGGIQVKEIHPSTMESKYVKGLYFAGEVLDLDALTGGYNLQIAWSTGYLAGISMCETNEL